MDFVQEAKARHGEKIGDGGEVFENTKGEARRTIRRNPSGKKMQTIEMSQ